MDSPSKREKEEKNIHTNLLSSTNLEGGTFTKIEDDEIDEKTLDKTYSYR